jgi:hypothetical protein
VNSEFHSNIRSAYCGDCGAGGPSETTGSQANQRSVSTRLLLGDADFCLPCVNKISEVLIPFLLHGKSPFLRWLILPETNPHCVSEIGEPLKSDP